MSEIIKLKRGLTIPLKGKSEKIIKTPGYPQKFALKPTDFKINRPKPLVKIGDRVKAGTAILFDKKINENIKFTAPVSGKIEDIVRGERRKLLEIVINPDKKEDIEYEEFKQGDPEKLSEQEIKDNLLKSGLWPAIRQRPYNTIANPEDKPRDIYISAFDTAPLAPDFDFIMNNSDIEEIQTGINALKKLNSGHKIELNINAQYSETKYIKKLKNININRFLGKHPAGNVGVQINNLKPINKGEKIWTVGIQDIIDIGRLFLHGKLIGDRIVALTGSEVEKTFYARTYRGASVKDFFENNIKESDSKPRFISGNVLTGTKIAKDGYLGFYDSQLTVIPEGDKPEFLGWGSPGFKKFSHTSAFLSKFIPRKNYRLNTNMHGGERAYVVTGEYEKVTPMDIYPQQLIKSIIIKDIDKMEQLGIYEVAEEDLALCEFVCTSKINVQEIVSNGIDLMISELE